MQSLPVDEVVEALTDAVDAFQSLELDALTARETMALARAAEVVQRRVHAGTDRLAGHLDETGKHGVDGHKTAKAALVHLGRVPGAEAFGRVRTARALRALPAVRDAYARGDVPVEAVRVLCRLWSNPRVQPLLDDMLDKIIAEQATTERYTSFVAWLRDLEAAADPDGAGADSERSHERRTAQLTQNELDGSWELRGSCGALHGAALAEVLAAFEWAEWEADRVEAIQRLGTEASADRFRRTPQQRRMDAIVAIFRAAGSTAADAQRPEPLVNVLVDLETLEEELARVSAGDEASPADGPAGERRIDDVAEGRVCRTVGGRPLHPADVVTALLIGQLRRVVVDSASNVIDLGRRRRLFTGSSRDAAMLQAAVRARGGHACFWSGCDGAPGREQTDHDDPWGSRGRTDVGNSNIGCGFHNRLKESGFRPVRRADGRFDLLRPDGTRITPPA